MMPMASMMSKEKKERKKEEDWKILKYGRFFDELKLRNNPGREKRG